MKNILIRQEIKSIFTRPVAVRKTGHTKILCTQKQFHKRSVER